MMLQRWLKKSTYPAPPPGLPDPNTIKNPEIAEEQAAINREVVATTPTRKRKRGDYNAYDDETRAKIAKYAQEHGNTKAARHFSTKLGRKIAESTVCSMKQKFLKAVKENPTKPVTSLPNAKRGRPLMLGELDKRVQTAIQRIREDGGTINRHITLATATAIVRQHQPSLLKEHGGPLELNRHWCESLMKRMGLTKRKATKASRALPENFPQQKHDYLTAIADQVKEHDIPNSMVVNFDQTGINIIPSSDWTMDNQGTKQVKVTGLGDKRQVTLVLACAMDGELLPPQVIYQGKTDKSHPSFDFPANWDIHHSPNHWSNSSTMERYAEKILLPHFERARERLQLPPNQWGLAIFDMFKAHQMPSFTKMLHDSYIKVKFVPARCTSELQPLDLAGNKEFKDALRNQFSSWYADQVLDQLESPSDSNPYHVDLRLTYIKPLHARWMLRAWEELHSKPNCILRGWSMAGIIKACSEDVSDNVKDSVPSLRSLCLALVD